MRKADRKKIAKLENLEKLLNKINGELGSHSLINKFFDIFNAIPDKRMANKKTL